jgi:hypothetical protein
MRFDSQFIFDNIKKYATFGLGIGSIGIASIFGMNALYLSAIIGVSAAYLIYPQETKIWYQNHQPLLLGAAVGFLCYGPFGMLALGWLGNFLGNLFTQISQKIEPFVNALNRMAAPLMSTTDEENTNQLVREQVLAPQTDTLRFQAHHASNEEVEEENIEERAPVASQRRRAYSL